MSLVAIPVKPFGIAKARLAPRLDARTRSRLGRAIAEHTATAAASVGADVVIVTEDSHVAGWAHGLGLEVVDESTGPGRGLDRAARMASRWAAGTGRPWVILHADLPLLRPDDVKTLTAVAGPVLAPSYDGGTGAIGGSRPDFPFSYGPGSFGRHLRAEPRSEVVIRPGLAHDLDTLADLALAASSDAGSWLSDFLP